MSLKLFPCIQPLQEILLDRRTSLTCSASAPPCASASLASLCLRFPCLRLRCLCASLCLPCLPAFPGLPSLPFPPLPPCIQPLQEILLDRRTSLTCSASVPPCASASLASLCLRFPCLRLRCLCASLCLPAPPLPPLHPSPPWFFRPDRKTMLSRVIRKTACSFGVASACRISTPLLVLLVQLLGQL